ncbi:MAG: enoyl-CoA hydratase/isomerase family protein [Pseudomonadales bacterium]
MEAILTKHDNWAELVLNRPERKNAITGPLGQALTRCLEEIHADDALQVVLLRGEGGAFCSGLDLKYFNAEPPPEWLADFQKIWRGVHRALFDCNKPIIGALERYAINGGAALALACDLLIVGEEAFLQVGEIQLGMAAPYNLAWLALRHPESVASRLAMAGSRFKGAELVDLGVATECVPDQTVLDRARASCETLAGYPPGAGARIKAGIRARLDVSADGWFDRFTGIQKGSAAPPDKVS